MASILRSITDRIEEAAVNAVDTLQELEKLMTAQAEKSGTDEDYYDNYVDDEDAQNSSPNDDFEMFEDQYNPLDGMAENLRQELFSQGIGPETFKEHLEAFASAITWKEPFILMLMSFHISVLVLAVFFSKRGHFNARVALFCFIALVVYSAERLNSYGSAHWQEWGITQNYFDNGGWFMATMVCGPLLTVFVGMLLGIIWEAKLLMTEVQIQKRRRLAHRAERQRTTKAKKE
mmetsp:Transcript_18040/g.26826  ORF Transcript_18040/g.26826 Transcript_18040/m.26826 type:complete len:233 (-) Transcript_18040:244-942(-)